MTNERSRLRGDAFDQGRCVLTVPSFSGTIAVRLRVTAPIPASTHT